MSLVKTVGVKPIGLAACLGLLLLASCSGSDPAKEIAFFITVHKDGTYSFGSTEDSQEPGTLDSLRPHLDKLESDGGALLIIPDGVYGGAPHGKLMDVLSAYEIELFLQTR